MTYFKKKNKKKSNNNGNFFNDLMFNLTYFSFVLYVEIFCLSIESSFYSLFINLMINSYEINYVKNIVLRNKKEDRDKCKYFFSIVLEKKTSNERHRKFLYCLIKT